MWKLLVLFVVLAWAFWSQPVFAAEPRMTDGQRRPVGEIVFPRVTLAAFPIPMGTLVQYVGSSKGEPALKWGNTTYVFPQMFVRYHHGDSNSGTSGPAYVGVFGTVDYLYEGWLSDENRWSGYFGMVELDEPIWSEAELRVAAWASAFADILVTSQYVMIVSRAGCEPVVYMDGKVAEYGPYTGTYFRPNRTQEVRAEYPSGCHTAWTDHWMFAGDAVIVLRDPVTPWDLFQLSVDPNPYTFCWVIQQVERVDGEEDGLLELIKGECEALAQR